MRMKWGLIGIVAFVAEASTLLFLLLFLALFGPQEPTAAKAFAANSGLWIGLFGGFLTCLFGGYFASRFAKDLTNSHGLMVGFATALIDIAILVFSGASLKLLLIISNLARVVAGVLGAYWFRRRFLGE